MDSVKCTNCGLVSWADATSCKRCGEPLIQQGSVQTYIDPPGNKKSLKLPYLISGILVAVVLCGLAVGLSIFFLRAHALSTPAKWREHVSVDGGYSLQLPGDPHENQRPISTPTGQLTIKSVTAYVGQNGEYMSSYLDLSSRKLTVSDDEFLELMFRQTTRQENGVVLNKKPLIFDSANGLAVKALEAEIQLDEKTHGKGAVSIVRLYWVRDRKTVYMNVATFMRSPNHTAIAAKFLDSFRLAT